MHVDEEEEELEENIYAVENDVCVYLIVFILYANICLQSSDEEKQVIDGSQQRFTAHVPVPSQQEVEQALLKKRKQELMEKYGVQEN